MPQLKDSYGRQHTYLRVSLTERCNLRCAYCMPAEGAQLSPASHLMNREELVSIVKEFVNQGVTKVRLTGGEPLIRKDAREILRDLGELPISLGITTNGIIVDRFVEVFKEIGLQNINVSIDSLQEERFNSITRRPYFQKVWQNIQRLLQEGFHIKLNAVLMKGFNEDEIVDFVKLSQLQAVHIRFIEFMPFDGNRWNRSQLVSYQEVMEKVYGYFGESAIERLADAPNDTAKNYRLKGVKGTFGIISSVTNPFCDTCNRLRLTANGRIKNCLFSSSEVDLLGALRKQEPLVPLMQQALFNKHKVRGGMDTDEKLDNPNRHTDNRSMILIGG